MERRLGLKLLRGFIRRLFIHANAANGPNFEWEAFPAGWPVPAQK